MNGHLCSQLVDSIVMGHGVECSTAKPGLEVQSIMMDHILCRRLGTQGVPVSTRQSQSAAHLCLIILSSSRYVR